MRVVPACPPGGKTVFRTGFGNSANTGELARIRIKHNGLNKVSFTERVPIFRLSVTDDR